MPPSAPPAPSPLPVAAERAVLSNRISMLFAKQASLRASLNRPSSARPAAAPQRRRAAPDDEDDAVTAGGTNPNAGPGYVSSKKELAESATDRMLRGRLLGKRKADAAARAKAAESESEEDEGRSGLGKRKRPRREQPVDVEVGAEEAAPEGDVESGGGDTEARDGENTKDDQELDAEAAQVTTAAQPQANGLQEGAAKKRKNKKKKKKNKAGASTSQE